MKIIFNKDNLNKMFFAAIIIGIGCFVHFALIPSYKEARAQDYEMFYGRQTYEVWCKVHPDKELTYEEWKLARYTRVIKYKEY